MKSPKVPYWQLARMEDMASAYEYMGYVVHWEAGQFDFAIEKDGKKIAINVESRGSIKERAPSLSELKRQAAEQGFDDFRLTVVSPYSEKSIEVDGLEESIRSLLVEGETPSELDALSSATQVEGAGEISIDSINVKQGTVQVVGEGIVYARLVWGGGDARDGAEFATDFPFSFSLVLDSGTLAILDVEELDIDVSSYYE